MDNLPPPPRDLDDQEESVRIAVKALGDMRKSGGRGDASRNPPHLTTPPSTSSPYPTSSTPRSPTLSTTSTSSQSALPEATGSSGAFVSRMSNFPLVGSALRVYEQGKASSRVVKYGAEMMESSVKTISRPVIDRLPVNVNQIEEFSCRQLDRLDRFRRPSNSDSPTRSSMAVSPNPSVSQERERRRTKTFDGSIVEEVEENSQRDSSGRSRQWSSDERNVPSWLEASSPFVAPPPPPPEDRSATPTQNDDARSDRSNPPNQVAQRSRWQAMLLEAGGLSAALSEENMRRLKYCLQWLQYATAHIDAQILILRDFTANLQPLPSDSLANSRRPPISEEHMRKLTDVRRDIVHTVRQVVDVVSKYAGSGLPEPARARVKGLILKLPQRWANRAGTTLPPGSASSERETIAAAGSATGALRRPGGQRRAAHRERGAGAEGLKSGPNSRAPSPSSSPRISRAALATQHLRHASESQDQVGPHVPTQGHTVSPSAALVASQRILTLATESLDMMRNVTSVVKESLDRADAWVGRFRTVGLRGAQDGEEPEDDEFQLPERMRHRRTDSAQSDFNDTDGTTSPFFSSSSASNWGSSIPSTPGGGTFTPAYSSYAGNAPSPGAIPIGAMSLASRYSTPKSTTATLPEDDSELSVGAGHEIPTSTRSVHPKIYDSVQDVRVKVYNAESDIEHDSERGVQKMEVDV